MPDRIVDEMAERAQHAITIDAQRDRRLCLLDHDLDVLRDRGILRRFLHEVHELSGVLQEGAQLDGEEEGQVAGLTVGVVAANEDREKG